MAKKKVEEVSTPVENNFVTKEYLDETIKKMESKQTDPIISYVALISSILALFIAIVSRVASMI